MVRDTVVNLIKETITSDEIGNQIPEEKKGEVFATVESISSKEFHNAGQSGLKPEFKVTIYNFEYDNESIVELNNIKYSVYRTYVRKDDKIELYLIKKAGV